MTVTSPDDYRRAAGFRRSESGRRIGSATAVPVQALTALEIDDPLLRDFMGGGRLSEAGVSVTERLALGNSAFFRAMKLISSSIGMLPIHLHRRKADGTTEKAKDHPLYRVLHKRPNEHQTAVEFKSYMQLVALLDGNAYAQVVWGMRRGRRAVLRVVPFKRRSIEPLLDAAGGLTFRYCRPGGGTVILPATDVFHFRHPVSLDGLKGISLLDVARDTLGLAKAAERAISKMLAKGVMAGGAIEVKEELGDDAYDRLKSSLREDYGGAENAGEWMLLEGGAAAKPFLTAKDSQTDETRKRQDEETARFTDVPRPLLMMDETSWGTGIRELGLFFVTYCLNAWFVAWEQAIERSLLTEDEQDADELYAKFNDGALLRGSLKEQAEFYAKALGNNAAWMIPNEVRAAFELNPREDGMDLPKPAAKAPPAAKEPDDE